MWSPTHTESGPQVFVVPVSPKDTSIAPSFLVFQDNKKIAVLVFFFFSVFNDI